MKLEKTPLYPDSKSGRLKRITTYCKRFQCAPHLIWGWFWQENQLGRMVYSLPAQGLSLATAFDLMETARKDYNVKEYSISQPTLEQVFVRLAHS